MPVIKNILGGSRSAERERWRRAGWASALRFDAFAPDGRKLRLTIRTPLDWKKAPLDEHLDETPPAGSIAAALFRLAAVNSTSDALAVVGIEHTVERDPGPDLHLIASLTVVLRDVGEEIPESLPDAEVEPVTINAPGGPFSGVRARKVERAEIFPEEAPIPVYVIQYRLRTPYGVLSSTYATPQQDLYARLIPALDKLASGVGLELAG